MEQMISQSIKSTRTATLEDRIKDVRAEIKALIDAKAEAVEGKSARSIRRDPQPAHRAGSGMPLRAISRDRSHGVIDPRASAPTRVSLPRDSHELPFSFKEYR